jgi:hypothetical protein
VEAVVAQIAERVSEIVDRELSSTIASVAITAPTTKGPTPTPGGRGR